MNPSDSYLQTWQQQEALAEAVLPLIGKLYRKRGVVLYIYGRSLVHTSTIGILKAHRYSRQLEPRELTVHETFPLLKVLSTLDLDPAKVDLGKLTTAYLQSEGVSVEAFLSEALAPIMTGNGALLAAPQDIVLYGFGRIGRLLSRILIERTGGGDKLRLRGIVVRKGSADDLRKRASLLRRDSVHGPFEGTISVDEKRSAIIANGNYIQVIHSDAPDAVDYTQYGVDNAIVVDNTGRWRDEAGLGLHLKAKGVDRVLLTAPGKGSIKNIVYGVNHCDIGDDKLLSAASCTTNAIVPVLKAINDKFPIENGHVETVHSYTNDQNLIDNIHSKERRGRSAPLNMVLTETGAARAVAKALPELEGKLTGNAIRVPTPNVSMAILNLNLESATTKEALNAYLRSMSLHSDLKEQIDYRVSTELVSSDLVGSQHAGIVDAPATIVQDKRAVVYIWYDNEAGYSFQVMRVVRAMAGMVYPYLPA